jgi:hypothetical protein
MATLPPAVQSEPTNVMFVVTAALFTIIAVAYLAQLWRLVARLKANSALWLRLGEPSLSTLSGQRTFDRILSRPELSGITDPSLLREVYRTKILQLAGVLSFAAAVITFFVGRAGTGA